MRIKIISTLLIMSTLVFSCKSNKKADQTTEKRTVKETTMKEKLFNPAELSEEPILDIKTTEGTIRIKLYKETPLHRDNFLKLASEGYYNNILFHRVINNFMIQVGDPQTKDENISVSKYGTGGPGYNIPAEIRPQFTHKLGALAAARRGDSVNPKKESSGSQFYIVHNPETCAQLDGDYTIFGETIDGFDVIEKIATTKTLARDLPATPIKIISILPAVQQ